MALIQWNHPTGFSMEVDANAWCRIVQMPMDLLKLPEGTARLPPDMVLARPLGTAFYFMRPDVVVTAKHIFTDHEEDAGPLFVLNAEKADGTHFAIVEDTWQLPHSDLAVLRVRREHVPALIPLFPAHYSVSQQRGFVAVGHKPSLSEVSSTGARLRTEINFVPSIATHVRERTGGKNEVVIEFDGGFIEGGNSGGPLMASGGGVIGVITGYSRQGESSEDKSGRMIGHAVSIEPLVELYNPSADEAAIEATLRRIIKRTLGIDLPPEPLQ